MPGVRHASVRVRSACEIGAPALGVPGRWSARSAKPVTLRCAAAGKGGKNRSRAKSDRDGKRELHFKNEDEGQEYAQVLKMHGGPWLEAYCFDGVKRMCHICGKMGRKVRITVGDIVLISLRGFQVGAS